MKMKLFLFLKDLDEGRDSSEKSETVPSLRRRVDEEEGRQWTPMAWVVRIDSDMEG